MELTAELVGVILDLVAARGAHLQQIVDLFVGDSAIGIVDVAVGASDRDHLAAQLGSLLHHAPAYVAEAGDGQPLALDRLALVLEDLHQIVHGTKAGGLRAHDGAAGGHGLAGQSAELGGAHQTAVLAIHIADLTAAAAQVAGGAVDVLADVAVQLGHVGLAETHDLGVALAAGIKVRAALGAADGQAGQGILVHLLKAQELDDGQVDGGMEPQAALVGAQGAVELDAVAAVDLIVALVIQPGDAELDGPLGLDHPLQKGCLLILGMGVDHGGQGGQDLLHGLQELRLAGILLTALFQNSVDILAHCTHSS